MNINQIIISGRLGAKPELVYTPKKFPILNFSIAQNGRENKPMWFNILVLGEEAEKVAHAYNKGDEVTVKGKVQIRSWIPADGKERTKVEILANEIKLTSKAIGSATFKAQQEVDSFNDFSSSTTMTEQDIPF